MSGAITTSAEVVRSTYQSLAKMMSPNAVDHHSRSEWIVGPRQPLGELSATTPFLDRLPILAVENFGEAAWNDLAGLLIVASDKDRRVLEPFKTCAGRSSVLHDDGVRDFAWGGLLELFEFALPGEKFGFRLGGEQLGALFLRYPEGSAPRQ